MPGCPLRGPAPGGLGPATGINFAGGSFRVVHQPAGAVYTPAFCCTRGTIGRRCGRSPRAPCTARPRFPDDTSIAVSKHAGFRSPERRERCGRHRRMSTTATRLTVAVCGCWSRGLLGLVAQVEQLLVIGLGGSVFVPCRAVGAHLLLVAGDLLVQCFQATLSTSRNQA